MMNERIEDWLQRIRRELAHARSAWSVIENDAFAVELVNVRCGLRNMFRHWERTRQTVRNGFRQPIPLLCVLAFALTLSPAITIMWTAILVVLNEFVKRMNRLFDDFNDDDFDDNDHFVRPAVPVEVAYPVATVDPLDGSRDIDIR